MAGSPKWKIFRGKEYVASCKYAEDAAVLVSASGGTVKLGHSLIVWREGEEEFSAGESYDAAGEVMRQREFDAHKKLYERTHGKLPSTA